MEYTLNESEVRVLGALVEKAETTPEYYPLTLNALVNACNQKSNRDPVVCYDDQTVVRALESLREKGLVRAITGDRVPKYRHYFDEAYQLSPAEMAVLCELMLRGPQTFGELRGRIERFGQELTIAEVESLLENLEVREDGPLVVRLPRQPGRKEARYMHLIAGKPDLTEFAVEARVEPATQGGRAENARIARLEEEVTQLREALAVLQQQFDDFRRQFE